MKKLIILLIICSSALMCETSSAQISFNVNIGLQPMWGPVGYNHVEYYYLPEIEAYYYVPTHKYFYMVNGRWINNSYLPARYRNYDMYHARKIVINEPRPYLRHNDYKFKYQKSNQRENVQVIRDSREPRYFESKEHPQHNQWKRDKKDQRDNGKRNKRERD